MPILKVPVAAPPNMVFAPDAWKSLIGSETKVRVGLVGEHEWPARIVGAEQISGSGGYGSARGGLVLHVHVDDDAWAHLDALMKPQVHIGDLGGDISISGG